jgi:hypothetical protein
MLILLVARLVLPVALTIWLGDRLRAWDLRRDLF